MNFALPEYLVFILSVLTLLWLIPPRVRLISLLIASLFFYCWWDYRFIMLLIWVGFVTWAGGLLLEQKRSIALLWVFAAAVLSPLFFLKYTNFLIENLNASLALLGRNNTFSSLMVILPTGISFFTFQSIGYLVDVKNERIPAEKNFFFVLLFINYFPQIVAGPIERASHLIPQLKELVSRHVMGGSDMWKGLGMIVHGLFFKVLIADNIAPYVDVVFASPADFTAMDTILAVYAFSIQIYSDFFGYTLIALGSAGLMGIELVNNFEHPYWACNIQEFWRKWHISLSLWFRDYVYIPLGGNKKGVRRTLINLLITMGLVGLWHGASWNFIIWGGLHGLFLVLHRFWKSYSSRFRWKMPSVIGRAFGWMLTFHAVAFAWIFFRAPDLTNVWRILGKIFRGVDVEAIGNLRLPNWDYLLILIVVFAAVEFLDKWRNFATTYLKIWPSARIAIAVIIILLAYSPSTKVSQFIYFQF